MNGNERMTRPAISERELLEEVLPKLVTEKRLGHIASVVATAKRMCDRLCPLFSKEELSRDDLVLAACLHDVTKSMDQNALAEKYGLTLSEDDRQNPETLHALTGACYASEHFDVSDAVLSAIRKHTVGDPAMSLTDKLLYIADYIEETRPYEDCRREREAFFGAPEKMSKKEAEEHVDLSLCRILAGTAEHLLERGRPVHRTTLETLRARLSEHKNDGAFEKLTKDFPRTAQRLCGEKRKGDNR